MSDPAVFTVAELAKRWRVSRYTIMVAIRAGRLAAFKVGGRVYRVLREEALRYESSQQQPAAAHP